MYVSVKREETQASLTKLAMQRYATDGASGQERASEAGFSKTLKKKQELNNIKRGDFQVSNNGRDAGGIGKPDVKKPDFHSAKNAREPGKPITKKAESPALKQGDEGRRIGERAKTGDSFAADAVKQRETAYAKEAVEREPLAEKERLPKEEAEKDAAKLQEVTALLQGLFAQQDFTKLPQEDLSPAIGELAQALSQLTEAKALQDAKATDLTQLFSAEELAKLIAQAEKETEIDGQTPGKMQALLKDLAEKLKPEYKGTQGRLEELLDKLNALSLQVNRPAVSASSEGAQASRGTQEAALPIEEQSKQTEQLQLQSGGSESREQKGVADSSKSPESAVKSETKAVESESFSAKLEAQDAKLQATKAELNAGKEVKTVMKTEVFEQIKDHLAKQSIKEDHSEMIIRLRPEELGKVELKLEVHKDQVIAKMNVASQMVKEAIESNLSDLKSSLKDKGFEVTSFDVNLSDNSPSFERRGESRRQNGRRGARELRVEETFEGASRVYTGTLEGLEQGSTFEELA